jgi:uncharacterized protein (DUF1800 family)
MQPFERTLAIVLCLSLISPASPVAAQSAAEQPASHPVDKAPHHARSAYHSTQLQGDDRILHALNRFTFGPRPGDLEAVRAMGLDKWFDQQLRPASLDQTDLNARLAQYPAMQWSPEQLLFRAPSNAIIRQVMDGKFPMPEKGALHAVYENEVYRVSGRKQAKQQQAASASPNATTMKVSASPDRNSMSPAPNQPASQMAASPSAPAETAIAAPPNLAAANPAPAVDEAQLRRVLDLPSQQRVARLATMQPQESDEFFKSLKPAQRASLLEGLSPDLRETVLDLENPQRLVNEEIIAQRLTRDIASFAQLQEVMTDFWLNHFNVFLHKDAEMPYYMVSYDRNIIRPLALGNFENLLEATAHSPAMLLYLDNASSIGPDSLAAERAKIAAARRPDAKAKAREGLNENYARELMELHTLGVNGGYTQADVTQVARILTGWGVDRPQRGGGFRFEPNRHEPGTKVVMGKKFKEHGEQEGRDLLHMLATHPSTAQFISRKLAVRFVSDNPPQALVDRLSKTFLSTDGNISAVLSTLFHSPEFWDTSVYRTKVKTPVEYVVSAARASNANIDNLQPLANAVREMGMPLYGCVTPNGYSWQSDTWVSTNALVSRMNFALSLAANRFPGLSVTWDLPPDSSGDNAIVANPTGPSPQAEESRLEALLLTGGISDSTRAAVLQQFEQQNSQLQAAPPAYPVAAAARPRLRAGQVSPLERQDQLLAGLLLGSPEFQRR